MSLRGTDHDLVVIVVVVCGVVCYTARFVLLAVKYRCLTMFIASSGDRETRRSLGAIPNTSFTLTVNDFVRP